MGTRAVHPWILNAFGGIFSTPVWKLIPPKELYFAICHHCDFQFKTSKALYPVYAQAFSPLIPGLAQPSGNLSKVPHSSSQNGLVQQGAPLI